MTARQWAIAVAVAGVVTTAAFFSPVIMLVTLSLVCSVFAVHGLARWRYLVAQRREIEEHGPRIDSQALMDTIVEMNRLRSHPGGYTAASPGAMVELSDGQMVELRGLHRLARAQYEGVELPMPIVQPFTTCPSCDVRGAHLAELDTTGTAWRRKCWECDYRWTEA